MSHLPSDDPTDVHAESPDASVAAGLEAIRDDAARQLRHIGKSVHELNSAELPRFSANLPEELSAAEITELERRVADLEPWLQGPFVLAGNFTIPGVWRNDQRWTWLDEHISDLKGKRVLDVGSNAGYDPFMFKLRGAADVLALEPFEFIYQAQFLESIYGTGVDFQQIGWQQLNPELHGRFQFVHCHGVLYHEPNPLGLLQTLRTMVADDGELLFGSMLHTSSDQSEYIRFVPDAYAGDRTWWFVPGRLAMRWMLEVSGFDVEELLLSEGPRGEFPTMNAYFRCRPVAPARELTGSIGTGVRPPVRFPVGHYYSPMYDAREIGRRRETIWPSHPRATPDIDWREQAQQQLCESVFAKQHPLALRREPSEDPTEYWADNDQYPALDAWVLAAMLRHLRPQRMVEIGSGFSSLITARVNREELARQLDFTCIEPYPRDFLQAGVDGITTLRVEQIQDTPPEVFDQLAANDILFVDTSHTVKTGGDVPWIFHEVIPRLSAGVHVHVHDIFLPGDYPEPWVMEGWGWNEVYLARSFLSYNDAFEIVWGVQFMLQQHHDAVLRAFPGQHEYEHRGGAALWMRRATVGGG
jgi:SAM-dependent methyltransferase